MTRPLRILWISHFVPFPPKGGCFQRSYNLIAQVGAVHEVHLLALKHKASTHPEAESALAREALLRHCRTVDIVDISRSTATYRLVMVGIASVLRGQPLSMTVYRSEPVRRAIVTLLESAPFDLVHFDTIGLAQYLPLIGDLPSTMTHHGAEAYMIRRRIKNERNLLKKLFFLAEWRALARYEAEMCRRFGVNITMSDLDSDLLRETAPDARFAVVPNGVDVEYFTATPRPSTRSLIFAGRLDQYSNRDGILFFMRDVWPELVARYPDATIDIIGSNPPAALRELAAADPRIRVHGFVDDVRGYFANARVAICPIRDGGGTRLKLLDALSQGMPLVSTTIGAEGIDVVPDRDLLIADTPAAFVAQLARLFESDELVAHLARNGRATMERTYAWRVVGCALMSQYARVIAAHALAAGAAQPAPAMRARA